MEKADPSDWQALAAEADADADAAEAAAAAANARARAIRLRMQAEVARSSAAVEPEELVFDTADDAVEANEEDGVPARRRRTRTNASRVRLTWVAAVIIVPAALALLGFSGYMMWQHRHVEAEVQRSAEFTAAARQGVITLMSLNFNTAQDDVKRIIDNTTGDFRKDFQSKSEEFARVAQASKVITEATVDATAVQSMTDDTATVLVAVTTQVSNSASEQQQPRSWRFRIDLARDGGQLKLAKVEFVP